MEMTITYDLLKSYSNEELTAIELSIDEIKKERAMVDFKNKKEDFKAAFEALREIGATIEVEDIEIYAFDGFDIYY